MKTEVVPGSPEDRILTAVLELKEASGEVITPRIRDDTTCYFMMGYTAGTAVCKATFASTLGKEKAEKLGMLTVEETIEDLIASTNNILLGLLGGHTEQMLFVLDNDHFSDYYEQFLVVKEKYWEEHGHLDDRHIGGMPSGFDEVQESIFEYNGIAEEGRKLLLKLGYKEEKKLLE